MKAIIEEVAMKNNIDFDTILPLAIRRRIDRKSLEYHHLVGAGQVSPLAAIEPLVVGIIL